MKFELSATKRTLQGTGASRRLRRADKLPGIIYGGNAEPMLIELPHNDFFLSLRKEGFTTSMLSIKVDGQVQTVLLRDVQLHPFKRLALHADFLRVDTTHAIQQKVPLRFINADIAPGVKISNGIVSHTMNEILVSCLPQDLPPSITVDLKDLEAGKTIHISQLSLPASVKPVVHPGEDPVVVSIVTKRTAAETSDDAAAAPDAAATPSA